MRVKIVTGFLVSAIECIDMVENERIRTQESYIRTHTRMKMSVCYVDISAQIIAKTIDLNSKNKLSWIYHYAIDK